MIDVDKSQIFINMEFDSKQEALSFQVKNLVDKNIVDPIYEQKILEREKIYPTGLKTEKIGIAIPHADHQWVFEPKISIMTLKKPVLFNQMDDPKNEIKVDAIFLLAIDKPHGHIQLLTELFTKIQDSTFLDTLKNAETKEDIIKLFEKQPSNMSRI